LTIPTAPRSTVRSHIAGLPLMPVGVTGAQSMLWADARVHHARVYVLVNAYSALLRRNSDYSAVLHSERTVPLPDGAPLAWGASLVGQHAAGRCPGPDLLEYASEVAARDGTRFFFLGGGPGVAEALAAALLERHPGLQITGAATPPYGEWPEEASRQLVRAAVESGADVVWLGVSAPKQEVWALRWVEEIGRPVVCVGAAFDFVSGGKARAPRWMRTIGLEWLFRLVWEPRRLWKRYLVGNAVFLWDLLRYWGRPSE
jgi:N-acetylglucosaminyldiphosphoundecaprenol N-acetyl-beta-D-mannosaminyltransferase